MIDNRLAESDLRAAYEQYRNPLFRFGYRMTGSVEAAEDMVHDAFVGLFRGGFDPRRAALKTWLYAAVRNLALKRFRDAAHDEPVSDTAADESAGALEVLISAQTAEGVRQAVESLPLPQREAIVLFEYEELSLEEIAAIAEIDVGAVKARLYRARERLRRTLIPSVKGVSK